MHRLGAACDSQPELDRLDSFESCSSMASSCGSESRSSLALAGGSDESCHSLPLRRHRRKQFSRRDAPDPVDWLGRFRQNPLIVSIIGIAHVVGLRRVATTFTRLSSSLNVVDLDDTLDDTLDERDYPDGSELLDDGFGFYVAITPPTSRAGSIDASFCPP